MRSRAVRAAALVVAAVATVSLSACVSEQPMPVPTQTATAAPTPEPNPTATVPVLRPGESAAANHQFFDYLNEALHATGGMSDGRTIVDNLVANGFTKSDIEVTFDITALEIAVDSIQVSVRIQEECLVGGFSPAAYTSVKAPVLGTGKCLVGTTRPIDW